MSLEGLCQALGAKHNDALSDKPLIRPFRSLLVELSGHCPPSPKSLPGAFSKLSFDFYLLTRTSRSGTYRAQQILVLERSSDRASAPARVDDRFAERFGPTLRDR
jgi:hypothetical protein